MLDTPSESKPMCQIIGVLHNQLRGVDEMWFPVLIIPYFLYCIKIHNFNYILNCS